MIKQLKKITEPQELDYEALRLEGIRLVQKLCGNIWTDFNPHDPGITILEQIVYALTDLGYKAGFDIETFLTQADGSINYAHEALYTREQVMQQFPVTVKDYERFFETKLGMERVDFHVDAPGIYSVRLWPAATCTESHESLLKRFATLWSDWRCLGEKVADVIIETENADPIRHQYDILFKIEEMATPDLPKGNHCNFLDFFPLIEQFPSIYRYGKSADELKKYLEPIEHIFMIFLQAMQDFADMFSIHALKTDFEHYNQILNQMLAMYGVTFPDALFLLMHEANEANERVPYHNLLRAKVRYLRHLPELHLHRCGKWWKRRIEIMLGIATSYEEQFAQMHALDGVFIENGFGKIYIVWSIETPLTNSPKKRDGIEHFIRDELPAHLVPVFYWVTSDLSQEFYRSAESTQTAQEWLEKHENYVSETLWL